MSAGGEIESMGHVYKFGPPDQGCQCAACKCRRLEYAAPHLFEALRDLLRIIEIDELIPESVSYMQQARAALAMVQS